MAVTRPRTPGIWMTEQQFLTLLEELHVLRVSRPGGKTILLEMAGEQGAESISATDLKKRSLDIVAELEERNREIEENRFTLPVNSEISAGEGVHVRVDVVKRNDQLTPEEEHEKQRLLRENLSAIAHHRLIVGGMNYLQVHYRELEPELARREMPVERMRTVRQLEGRVRWSKGIKSAAIHCIRETTKSENSGRPVIEICREFLAAYVIDGEEEYTPEQMVRNIQQILLLDRAK